jgi:TorA maturation chaperone TorD
MIPMDATNPELLAARAEFYLCLARAFLPPTQPQLFPAMRELLADDLAELAAMLGHDIQVPLADLRAELARVDRSTALLQIYSAVFLAPPAAAHINAGQYLDGAVNGGSVKALEADYARCGVQRDEGFRDLADHVAVQLEFVAWLYGTQAERCRDPMAAPLAVDPGQFLQRFAMRWLGPFCADLARAEEEQGLPANPYRPLALILREAVLRDAVPIPVDPKVARRTHAIEQARAKYAGRRLTAEDIDEIRCKLQARGLSTDHLVVPVADRDGAMGLGTRRTPGMR